MKISDAVMGNLRRFVFIFHLLILPIGTEASAAARLEPLTVGYSNFTGTYGPLWVAVEEQVGAKYGLDLKAIYAGRIRPQQLLATGEVPVALASATGTMISHILGVKDQVLVGQSPVKSARRCSPKLRSKVLKS